nr:MAG TPA: hypothetical protein [Crassvirales sp.]
MQRYIKYFIYASMLLKYLVNNMFLIIVGEIYF